MKLRARWQKFRSSAPPEPTSVRSRTTWARPSAAARTSPKSSALRWANSLSIRPRSLKTSSAPPRKGDLARYVIPLERLLPELPSVTILPDPRKARAPRLEIQRADRADSARPRRAPRKGATSGTQFRRMEARAPPRLQPAGAPDRHRRGRRAAHLPARRRPRGRGLNESSARRS